MSDEGLDPVAEIASDPEAVEALSRMINTMHDAVKKDGVRAFGLVVIHGDGGQGSSFYTGDEFHRLLGGLTELQLDIQLAIRRSDEGG